MIAHFRHLCGHKIMSQPLTLSSFQTRLFKKKNENKAISHEGERYYAGLVIG
jgi:hypothetical protein